MKTRYYIFGYDQAGFRSITFWRELSELEEEALIEEFGSLTEAAYEDSGVEGTSDGYWLLPESDLVAMQKSLKEVFGGV